MVNFWMNDISILLNKDSIFEIIPTTEFDLNRKLNAVFRFSIYFSILSFSIYKNNSVFCYPFIVMLITIYIFKYSGGKTDDSPVTSITNDNDIQDSAELLLENNNPRCNIPKQNNPFMNLNMFDIPKNKKQGCLSYDNDGVKEEIDKIFDEGLYKDPTDIYSNNNSQNRFYTMPNTKSANDQGKFADWLYKTSTTCKEPGGGVQCSANLYNRSNDNGIWRASGGGSQFVSGDGPRVSLDSVSKEDTKKLDDNMITDEDLDNQEEERIEQRNLDRYAIDETSGNTRTTSEDIVKLLSQLLEQNKT